MTGQSALEILRHCSGTSEGAQTVVGDSGKNSRLGDRWPTDMLRQIHLNQRGLRAAWTISAVALKPPSSIAGARLSKAEVSRGQRNKFDALGCPPDAIKRWARQDSNLHQAVMSRWLWRIELRARTSGPLRHLTAEGSRSKTAHATAALDDKYQCSAAHACCSVSRAVLFSDSNRE